MKKSITIFTLSFLLSLFLANSNAGETKLEYEPNVKTDTIFTIIN